MSLPKIVGTTTRPIQVVKSYFAGLRKYNRKEVKKGNRRASTESVARAEMEVGLTKRGSTDPSQDEGDEFSERTAYRRNYGKRVVDPWVVGVYKSDSEVRFFMVSDRTGATLRKIIRNCCEPSSFFRTDEWKVYNGLEKDGFVHEKVNSFRFFIDSITKNRPQGIERI